MRLVRLLVRDPRRALAKALLTSLLSVPTASCVKEQSQHKFTSTGNATSDNKDKTTNSGVSGEDPGALPAKSPTPAPKVALNPNWDGNSPRGNGRYAVVATE